MFLSINTLPGCLVNDWKFGNKLVDRNKTAKTESQEECAKKCSVKGWCTAWNWKKQRCYMLLVDFESQSNSTKMKRLMSFKKGWSSGTKDRCSIRRKGEWFHMLNGLLKLLKISE